MIVFSLEKDKIANYLNLPANISYGKTHLPITEDDLMFFCQVCLEGKCIGSNNDFYYQGLKNKIKNILLSKEEINEFAENSANYFGQKMTDFVENHRFCGEV